MFKKKSNMKKVVVNKLEQRNYYKIVCPFCGCKLYQDDNFVYCSKDTCRYLDCLVIVDKVVINMLDMIKLKTGIKGLPSKGNITIFWND
jgi:predicted membrane-bound spermidine synthase